MTDNDAPPPDSNAQADLSAEVAHMAPTEAAELLSSSSDGLIADVLESVSPGTARDILDALPEERQKAILEEVSDEKSRQWTLNETFPEDSVGRLMDPPFGIFPPERTVAEAVAELRVLVKGAVITYAFIKGPDQRLQGV